MPYLHYILADITKLYLSVLLSLWCYSLKNKTISSKRMRSLVSVSVDSFIRNSTGTLSAFPCAKTQQVGRMRSSVASVIDSVLKT